jgi:hypothetical protein
VKSVPKKPKPIVELSPLEKRLKAVDYALWAGNLLEPKYFDAAAKAIKDKNKDAFLKTCIDAGIPKDVSEKLSLGMVDFKGDWGW